MIWRIYIPTGWRDIFWAAKYYWHAGQVPGHLYDDDRFFAEVRAHTKTRCALADANLKLAAQAQKMAKMSKEISALKRADQNV